MNRRILSTLMLMLSLVGNISAGAVIIENKPNVVFFLVDDLGYMDLGCYGSKFHETPRLDRLAQDGARFTNAYAACPVCSPTRSSLMTGQWPQRIGITDYIGAPQPEQWKRNTPLLPAPYLDQLPLDAPTLGKMMKSSGYKTFFAGKWHLGPEGHWPENQGFDFNLGGTDRGGPYGGNKYFSPYGNPRLKDGPDGEHLPARLANETADFIEKHKGEPFFAYLSFYSVHTPLMAREDLRKKYQQKKKQTGAEATWGREGQRDVRLSQDHAIYAGMVEAVDEAVGVVLDKLESLGLSDNTIVIFTSDNGGLSTSEGSPTSNHPMRAGKGWLYEGGIREPLLIRWPAKLKPKTTIDIPVSSPDFYATLMDISGAKAVEGQKVDGVSLLPLFSGEELAERSLYWHYPHHGNQGGAPGAAIRRGQWKLIEWFDDQRLELFDLSKDVSETVNLVSKHPDVVDRLSKELKQWQKDVGAKFPTANPAYDSAKQDGRSNAPKGATAAPQDAKPESSKNYFGSVIEKLKKKWPKNRTVRFVFHGHSVPAGYFKTPKIQRFDSYPSLFHQEMSKRFETSPIDVSITAIGGENSASGSQRFESDVLALKPDVVFIDYALNDRRMGLKQSEASWRQMIEACQKAKVLVVLLTPTPDSNENILDEKSPLNLHTQQIIRLGREFQIPVVDSYSSFRDQVAQGKEVSRFLSQPNHPNREGHELVTEQLLKLFE